MSKAEELAKWHEAMASEPKRNEGKRKRHADSAAELRSLSAERDSLRAVNAELLAALGSIEEYWNQDQNEPAMADACWHAIETARAAIASARKRENHHG